MPLTSPAARCHHVPAAAFEHAVKQVPARRWLGLTATPFRRDKLDDLIALQVGPVRHTIETPGDGSGSPRLAVTDDSDDERPSPDLRIHPTRFVYTGDVESSGPGWIAGVYRELASYEPRNAQIVHDVIEAVGRNRNCLVLTMRTDHLDRLATALRADGLDPVLLRELRETDDLLRRLDRR